MPEKADARLVAQSVRMLRRRFGRAASRSSCRWGACSCCTSTAPSPQPCSCSWCPSSSPWAGERPTPGSPAPPTPSWATSACALCLCPRSSCLHLRAYGLPGRVFGSPRLGLREIAQDECAWRQPSGSRPERMRACAGAKAFQPKSRSRNKTI